MAILRRLCRPPCRTARNQASPSLRGRQRRRPPIIRPRTHPPRTTSSQVARLTLQASGSRHRSRPSCGTPAAASLCRCSRLRSTIRIKRRTKRRTKRRIKRRIKRRRTNSRSPWRNSKLRSCKHRHPGWHLHCLGRQLDRLHRRQSTATCRQGRSRRGPLLQRTAQLHSSAVPWRLTRWRRQRRSQRRGRP